MEIIRRKTGVLIATSCRLGGMLSDASAADTDTLEAFGEALGMAFQLSDDIMDITATETELEKEPGADMRNGLYTLPVLYALRRGEDREELSNLLAEGPPSGERLERALEISRAEATLDRARMTVTAEVARALSLASKLPQGAARSALESLARYLAVRCGAVPEPAGPNRA
jgi:heptaprenyl diphosphate synthase